MTPTNQLDLPALEVIRECAKGTKLACHRCFDLTSDPRVALEQLIDLGFDRVLTSGHARTAPEGAELIKKLVEQAAGRIEIIAGSGIRPHNVKELIETTDVAQVHASCFADLVPFVGNVDYGPTLAVSEEKVRDLVKASGL